jgi:hypothetical protein
MTIGQQIKWDFEANGYLEIKDKNGNQIYFEDSYGFWRKWERDSQGKLIYYEDSTGRWDKHKYDSKGNEIYLETSRGVIIDNRPKPCSDKEIVIEGVKYKLTKV